jgi:hypothetical protein
MKHFKAHRSAVGKVHAYRESDQIILYNGANRHGFTCISVSGKNKSGDPS